MKKKFLYKAGYVFVGTSVFITVILSSCVKEGFQNCENKLRFVYDYNMDRMDKFCGQVKYLSVFAFDSETGLFEEEFVINVTVGSNIEVDVPQSLYGKKHDLYIWAGLHPDSYYFPQMTREVSVKADLEVQVLGYEHRLVDNQLEPLWHGELPEVWFDAMTEKTETVHMIKNTNTFRLVVTFMNNMASPAGMPYTLDNLEVCVKSPNGWMAYDNRVLDDKDRYLDHVPYISATDDNDLVFEMNSLRLMEDRSNTLSVRNKITGEQLYTLDFNRYLRLLMLDRYKWIDSLQEYFDREDSFRFVIVVTDVTDPDDEAWASVNITINNWVVREHEYSGYPDG